MRSPETVRSPRRLASIALLCAAVAGGLPPGAAAADGGTELYLADGRFRVTAQWTTAGGASGPGRARPLTDGAGTFWFFHPDNVEVLVKVHDACNPPFDRFWVFAAGLTNVGVELTVEDTVAGTSHTYVNALHTPFQPVQDTTTFATCDVTRECGMGTFAEVQATPRPDRRAERAALAIGGGLTADEEDYRRVAGDLAAIDSLHPELADVEYDTPHVPDELLVGFEPAVYDQIENGIYDGWDCLNDWYGATGGPDFDLPDIGFARVAFDGIFDLDRLVAEYAELPGALLAETNDIVPPPVLPPPPALCAAAAGDTFRYYHRTWTETGLLGPAWYFTSTPGSTATLVGTHSGGPPFPDWWSDWAACFETAPGF